MSVPTASDLPLTQSQQLIWLGQRLQAGSPLNNMAFSFGFPLELDVERFRSAFSQLVEASDAMRTVFRAEGETVRQTVLPPTGYQLPFEDLSGTDHAEDQGYNYCIDRCSRPLDVATSCFDAILLKIRPGYYVLYLNQHHLITDGWGYAVQLRFLLDTYAGVATVTPQSFAAYVQRAAEQSVAPGTTEQRLAWESKVARWPAPALLYGRPNAQLSARSTRQFRYADASLHEALPAFCQRPEVRSWTTDLTLFTVYATALFAHLHRVTGATALTIGCPAHNRQTAEDKMTPGLFMELFPLHVELDPADTFYELLDRVKPATMAFLRDARPGTSSAATGRSFNVVFNYINQAFREEGDPEVHATWLHPGETEPGHHYKLQVYDFDNTGGQTISFDTNDAVIPAAFQREAADGYLEALTQLVTEPTTRISQLPGRQQEQLAGFNHTDSTYPTDKTMLDLVEEQVSQRRDETAVQFGEQQLTYGALDERAEALATMLTDAGAGPETLVAVCLDRSLEMMVGLLAVLKAGAAYLPIDPDFPASRIAFLCADAGARAVVTSREREAGLPVLDLPVIVVPTTPSPLAPSSPSLHLRPRPDNLMYLLYTSGSTGKPKGVMNQHDGLVNRLTWMQRTFQLTPDDVVLQKTTFTFDVAGWEFWWPLLAGARLVFAEPDGHKDPAYLRRAIVKYGVTTLHFVPPMLELFLLQAEPLPSLKRVICSGEALTVSQVNAFRAAYPNVELHNLYGPTEAAIDVTHWPVPAAGAVGHVPIGRSIANVPLRILGPEGQQRPVGVPGELYIGGVQVARGYHGRPELTAEKFVDLADGRYYRTGDLCRWLPDGNIDFLGRIDQQVKLRGYRIELGEIEHALSEWPGVQQAVVVLRKDGGGRDQLVGYLVGAPATDEASIRDQLAQTLPGYMVPTRLVFLEALPTLANGKIDRKALPEPEGLTGTDDGGGPPESEFEELILEAWAEVFAQANIGRKTHFLDLGGHSLTAIRLVNRVNETFELDLPANTVFRYPTIAELAVHVEDTIRRLMAAMNEH